METHDETEELIVLTVLLTGRRVKPTIPSDERRSVAKPSAAHRDSGKATDCSNLSFDALSLYKQQTPKNKNYPVEIVPPLPPAVVHRQLEGFSKLSRDPEAPLILEQPDVLVLPTNRTRFVQVLSGLTLIGGAKTISTLGIHLQKNREINKDGVLETASDERGHHQLQRLPCLKISRHHPEVRFGCW